jgi:hypothetical protein
MIQAGCTFKAVHHVAELAVPAHKVFGPAWRPCPAPLDAGDRVPRKDWGLGSAADADVELAADQQEVGPFTDCAGVLLEVYTVTVAKLQQSTLISTPMTARTKYMGCVAYHLAHVTHVCSIGGRGFFMHVQRHAVRLKRIAKHSPLAVRLFGVRHPTPRSGRLSHAVQVRGASDQGMF